MKKLAATGILMALLAVTGSQAFAYGPEGDLLKIKGYSTETIQAVDIERSRMEWRQPAAPRMSPKEKFFHNIYYGDWIGEVDDFGNTTMRSH